MSNLNNLSNNNKFSRNSIIQMLTILEEISKAKPKCLNKTIKIEKVLVEIFSQKIITIATCNNLTAIVCPNLKICLSLVLHSLISITKMYNSSLKDLYLKETITTIISSIILIWEVTKIPIVWATII